MQRFVSLLLSLVCLGCTAGERSVHDKDVDKVDAPMLRSSNEALPPPLQFKPDDPDLPSPPGVLEELTYSTTSCHRNCPVQDLIVRRDGAYMYLGLEHSRREGLYFDHMPAMAELLFRRASTHPFGAKSIAYIAPITEHHRSSYPTRYYSALDKHGRHYITNCGGPTYIEIPESVVAVENTLNDLIETIPSSKKFDDELDRRALPGPVCRTYGDALRERCAPLLDAGQLSASCLHHMQIAVKLDALLDDYDDDYVESGCIFMLQSLESDAGRADFVDPRAKALLDEETHLQCERLFARLLRSPEHFDSAKPGKRRKCEHLLRVGARVDQAIPEDSLLHL